MITLRNDEISQVDIALVNLRSIKIRMGWAKKKNNKILYRQLLEEKREQMNTLRAYGIVL